MKKITIAAGIVVALTLGACSTTAPSPKSNSKPSVSQSSGNIDTTVNSTEQWKSDHYDDVSTLVDDLGLLGDANTDSDMRDACAYIGNDVSVLQSDDPYPDPTVGPAFAASLASLAAGASACTAAIDQQNPALLQQAIDNFTAASNAISQVANA